VDDGKLARLIEEAVAARRVLTPETTDAVWDPLRRAADAGAAAVEAGLRMLHDADRDVRVVGCELLAECCNGRQAPTEEIAGALIELGARETDGEVHWSLATALGFTRDPAAVPTLVALAGHEDEDVRYQAARSLPDVAGERRDDLVVETLIKLTTDPNPDVRNWATYGLGRQLEDDSTTIREALWAATTDPEHDAWEEAACGLARRRDRRALPLIRKLLGEEDPHVWVFDAAEALGDPTLLPLLEPFAREGLEKVFAACDPDQQAARFRAAHAFLDLLQKSFDEHDPGRVATLSSCRLDTGLILSTGDDDGVIWSASAILDGADNDPAKAVAWVLEHLSGERPFTEAESNR
jgi:HEAT repeat protein